MSGPFATEYHGEIVYADFGDDGRPIHVVTTDGDYEFGECDRDGTMLFHNSGSGIRRDGTHDLPNWVIPHGKLASIEYGYDGSSWDQDYRVEAWTRRGLAKDKTECTQRPKEPFSNFIYRAHDQFDALLTPPCRGLRPCSYGDGFTGRPTAVPRWASDESWAGAQCEVGP